MESDAGPFESRIAGPRALFASGVTRPIEWRLGQLDALIRLLRDEGPRLEAALAEDLGRPAIEAFAADVGIVVAEVDHLRRNLTRWVKPKRARLPWNTWPSSASVTSEPLGVVLVIAPWNYPVLLSVAPLAAALAAGNTAVLKPSEHAPATSEVLAEAIPRHLDEGSVAVFEGGAEVAVRLLAERFDHIFFTGSSQVARAVAEAAAHNLTPVTLELGGKNPVVVGDTANMKVAGRRLAWAKWLNAGQSCVAPDYVMVSSSSRDELVDSMATAFDQFSTGRDPLTNPDLCSIINTRHAERLAGLLDGHGGVVVHGGDHDVGACRVAPTIVVDPALDSDLMSDEVFGPVLPVLTVDSRRDAIEIINSRPKPLSLYLFSEDDAEIEEVLAATSSGGVCINHVMLQFTASGLPFGGVGESGYGRCHGRAGFDAFSNNRSVMRKTTRLDLKFLYPPYSGFKERVIRRVVG